jgi:hypothetical protein
MNNHFGEHLSKETRNNSMFIRHIVIDFPALDRLLDYLSNIDQSKIDTLTGQVATLTQRLKTANEKISVAKQQS